MANKENTQETGLKVYEVGFLLVPTIAEEQVAGEVEAIKAAIEKFGGSFISEEFPTLRQLAYTMAKSANGALKQKFDNAYFGWIKFETTPAQAQAFKAEFEKISSVLRYLLITTVRENTMVSQKVMFKGTADGEKPKADEPEGGATVAPINEEELDKTLETIV
jgi:ribosomal protein S6